MNGRSLTALALLLAATLLQIASALAQTFKGDQSSIGGEGGHDYIVAEPGTAGAFVSRGPLVGTWFFVISH